MLLIKLLPTHTSSLGIYGIVGDKYALYIEISSSGIGIILSVMETALLAVTVKALVNLKKSEDALEQVLYAKFIQWVERGDFSIKFIHKKQLRGS